MYEQAQKPSRTNSLFWRVYMLSWAFLAGAALTYLSAFALLPENRERLLTNPLQSTQESNRADLERDRLNEQVRSLRETVANLRSDLARLAREKETARVAEAESRSPYHPPAESLFPSNGGLTTGSIIIPAPDESKEAEAAPEAGARDEQQAEAEPRSEPQPEPNPSPAQQAGLPPVNPPAVAPGQPAAAQATTPARRPRGNLAIAPLKPGRLPPLPAFHNLPSKARQGAAAETDTAAYKAVLLNGAALSETAQEQAPAAVSAPGAPVRQGSAVPVKPVTTVAVTKPALFGEPKVTQRPAQAPAALSLSTATSVTGLRASWLVLTTRHASTFSGLTPRYVEEPASGTYRLLAGPIADRTDADRICTALRPQGVSCGVTSYRGNPF